MLAVKNTGLSHKYVFGDTRGKFYKIASNIVTKNIKQEDKSQSTNSSKILEVQIFDGAGGKLATSAICDNSSLKSWISQDLRDLIRAGHSDVKNPTAYNYDGVELQSTGTLKVTWQKARGTTTYQNRFNITASIPQSCHAIIGQDILSREDDILADADPVLVLFAKKESKG
jgi:hypothetical protein